MQFKNFLLLLFLCCFHFSNAQKNVVTFTTLDSDRNVSLRGLSVVSNQVIWCSGSKGTVARSINGGKSFEWINVQGYEQRDFRDVEAFDANAAIIMAIAEPAIILKTKDGGKTWQKVFEDSSKGMFLDAMHFDQKGNGVVIGDPLNGEIYLARTKDNGNTWTKEQARFDALKGESFFASSGTNILLRTDIEADPYLFVSGGLVSHLFYRQQKIALPLMKGKESTGANSVAVWNDKAVVVGGDFTNDAYPDSNCVLIQLKKNVQLNVPIHKPSGYRSSVIFADKNTLICCGTSGVDISFDAGNNWVNISKQSFHVVQKAKKGNAIILAGAKGKITLLKL